MERFIYVCDKCQSCVPVPKQSDYCIYPIIFPEVGGRKVLLYSSMRGLVLSYLLVHQPTSQLTLTKLFIICSQVISVITLEPAVFSLQESCVKYNTCGSGGTPQLFEWTLCTVEFSLNVIIKLIRIADSFCTVLLKNVLCYRGFLVFDSIYYSKQLLND